MSRDQKPGRSKIVVNRERRRAPEAYTAIKPLPAGVAPLAGAASGAEPPLRALAMLFLAACAAGGVSIALLVWMMR